MHAKPINVTFLLGFTIISTIDGMLSTKQSPLQTTMRV